MTGGAAWRRRWTTAFLLAALALPPVLAEPGGATVRYAAGGWSAAACRDEGMPLGCAMAACGPSVSVEGPPSGPSCAFSFGDGFAGTLSLELRDLARDEVRVAWALEPTRAEPAACPSGAGVNGFAVEVPAGCGVLRVQLGAEATAGTGTLRWTS